MGKNYTDKELELVFEKILKMYKSSYSPKENPKVFLLGGQPGAGKTGLAIQRYEEMIKQGKTPRMTPKEHHDLVVNSIGDNLETIYNSKLFDEIRLFDRENNLLYSYKESPDVSPKDILEKEFSREWEKEEIEEYNERWSNLIKTMENRKASAEEISKVIIEKENNL